jgi:hypothetical protein
LRAAAAQISRSMPLQEVILRSGSDVIGGLRLRGSPETAS